jgi:hypothetical protein
MRPAPSRYLFWLQTVLTAYPLAIFALGSLVILRVWAVIGVWPLGRTCQCQLNTVFPQVEYDPWYGFLSGIHEQTLQQGFLPFLVGWLLTLIFGWRGYTLGQRVSFALCYIAGWLIFLGGLLLWFFD